jgi:hypothetical protein
MKEIGAERESAVQLWKSGLLASLGRTWTTGEEIDAETIASLFIAARRARDKGDHRGDMEYLREAATLMRDSVFRSPHATPAPSAMVAP